MRKVTVLTVSFLAIGCVHREDYIDSVVADEAQFNGVYSGVSDVVMSNTINLESSDTFGLLEKHVESTADAHGITHQDVRITVHNGLLTAQDLTSNKVVVRPYAFTNGRIEIETETTYMIYIIINGSKSRTITLSLDENGDLLIDDNFFSVGCFLIFPNGYSRNDIYKARRL